MTIERTVPCVRSGSTGVNPNVTLVALACEATSEADSASFMLGFTV